MTSPLTSLGSYLMESLLEEMKTMRTLWPVTPAQQQQETIDRIAAKVDAAVLKGVRDVLGMGFPAITVNLKKIDIDADGTVARITFRNEHLHSLTDCVGQDVVLCLVDPAAHAAGVHSFTADADQPQLPIE